jgi:hypothetical protein
MRKHQVRCRCCILGTRNFLGAYAGRGRMLVPVLWEVKRLDSVCHTTIEMSPGCSFTTPMKKAVFSFAAPGITAPRLLTFHVGKTIAHPRPYSGKTFT